MPVYILLILWCTIFGYLSQHPKSNKSNQRRFFGILPTVAIFIVSAIRYNVGSDYSGTYTVTYTKVLAGSNATMTPIPMLIYKVMARLGLDLQWFFVITSFLICYFVYKSINEQAKTIWLSYYIFITGCFLFFSFNGVRQAVSMAIFYYSIKYLDVALKRDQIQILANIKTGKNRSWIRENIKAVKYFVLNLVATGFHITGAVFIPLFFVLKKQLKFKTKLILFVGCVVFSEVLFRYAIRLVNMTRYSYYITNSEMFSQGRLNLSMYINILLVIIYEIIYYKKKHVTDRDIIYGNLHFCGLLLTLFVTRIPMAYRLFYSFRYIEYLSIPNLIEHGGKNKTVITITAVMIFFAYFLLMIGRNNSHDVLPYLTIFDR